MSIIRQFAVILVLWLIGEVISKALNIAIPGSVIGLVLLFICLYSGIIKVEMISELSYFILNNLAFFFIPLGVGLLDSMNIIKGNWLGILAIVIFTTIIVIVITGLTVQVCAWGRNR